MPFTPKKPNSGRMFDVRADKRRHSDPDFTGVVNIDGKFLRIAAWHSPKSEQHRNDSFGLSFEPLEDYERRRREQRARR